MPMMTAPSKLENIPDGCRPPAADNHANDSPPPTLRYWARLESGKPGWWPSGICVIVSIGHPRLVCRSIVAPQPRGVVAFSPRTQNWPFGRLLSNNTHTQTHTNILTYSQGSKEKLLLLLLLTTTEKFSSILWPPTTPHQFLQKKGKKEQFIILCFHVCVCVYLCEFSATTWQQRESVCDRF